MALTLRPGLVASARRRTMFEWKADRLRQAHLPRSRTAHLPTEDFCQVPMRGPRPQSFPRTLAFALLVPHERLKFFEAHFAVLIGVDGVEDSLVNGHHLLKGERAIAIRVHDGEHDLHHVPGHRRSSARDTHHRSVHPAQRSGAQHAHASLVHARHYALTRPTRWPCLCTGLSSHSWCSGAHAALLGLGTCGPP